MKKPLRADMEPERDEKLFICPICERGFKKMGYLKQHWTKKHKVEEINDIIASVTDQSNKESMIDDNNHPDSPPWNKFQIISDSDTGVSYNQFDVIEKDKTGDCLFASVLEFLRIRKDIFPTPPKDVSDLRTMAVNHILKRDTDGHQSNFERFQFNRIENLRNEIPSFSLQDTTLENLKSDYYEYMSTPHKYGTMTELCAMAEIFNFGFWVIRQTDQSSYSCYDYGSVNVMLRNKPLEAIHLLFTGNVDEGHFRLLLPKDKSHHTVEPGRYMLLDSYTSSKLTSIAPLNFTALNNDEVNDETNINDEGGALGSDSSFEDFVIVLAR
ncbi:hypothetical protein Bhyg_02988 [Pseudolycoriella hygida]|uniref:C2H2-type domain-containing protein n=1 Tax=Pseudolycoriella hygida TaxID=35572 RepID=A0A9Q0S8Y1_9DIPT|nr:hypothetical protein Bhyg_02988 [Pseudolycoriella hygida]